MDHVILIKHAVSLICKETKFCILNEINKDLPTDSEKLIQFIRSFIKENKNLDFKIIDLLKLIIKYFKTKSEIVADTVIRDYYNLIDKKIKITYSVKNLDVKKIVLALQKISNNKHEPFLTYTELLELKKSNKDLYISYIKYLKEYMNRLKKTAIHIIHYSLEKLLPLSEFNKKLQKYGFIPIYNNLDYKYLYVDNSLKLTLRNGKQLACNIPLYTVEIIINPEYKISEDNSFVLKFRSKGSSVWQYCYTVDFKKKKKKKIYQEIRKLMENIETYRKKWRRDLNSNDKKIREAAAIVDLLYQTSGRVGTPGNQTQGKETYGISTLLKKHIKIKGSRITISYVGKGGIKYKHEITDKKLAEVLKPWVDSKKDNERIFTLDNQAINTYLQNRIGLNITVHKLRTLQGTKLVYDSLKNISCKSFKNESDILKYEKQVLYKVGEILGHKSGEKVTYTTALKNYVDPKILALPYVKCGFPLPKAIQVLFETATSGSIAPAVTPASFSDKEESEETKKLIALRRLYYATE